MINKEDTTATNLDYGTAFEHFMTEEGNDGIERKGVFEATVSREGGDSFRIYYSGQIDAVKHKNGKKIIKRLRLVYFL